MKTATTILNKYLHSSRIEHSIRVAEAATRLCTNHKIPSETVTLAAILHDIAKEQTPETMANLGIDTRPYTYCWHRFPAVWHALVGPLLIELEFPAESRAVAPMVKWHTTGHKTMTTSDMIVFVADFIEPHRSHEKRQAVADMAVNNLPQAVAEITQCSIEKLLQKKAPIHPFTVGCWNQFRAASIDS
jgi:predicted HD superfamily hydrolase involved in NAD metabolism